MADDATLAAFREAGALLDGHFRLSSGLHSPQYLQCALVLKDPALAERLCRRLADQVRGFGVDVVIGPALGGILVAYELARALGLPTLFTERVDGTMTLRRGFRLEPGSKVLLAEDVVTTGGSLHGVLTVVREAGAEPVAVAALVNRTSGRDPAFGVPFEALVTLDVPTYEPEACPLCRDGVPVVKPGSRPGAAGEATR